MLHRLRQAGLLALLAASLIISLNAGLQLARNPLVRPLVERSAAELQAATDAALARSATEAHIAGLLSGHLAQDPRNWLALDALLAVAAERGLPLHPTLITRIETARAEDTGLLTRITDCATCAWDIGQCSLSQALICNAPITFTTLGDGLCLTREGVNYFSGAEVDRFNTTLCAVGLGAAVVTLASAGTATPLTLPVKEGASVLRLGREMKLLSPRLTGWLTRSADDAIDWNALRAEGAFGDLRRAIKPGALDGIETLAVHLLRLERATGPTEALHLLRYVDTPEDAARLARTAEALGPKTLGRIEVLGKTRLFRLGLRLSDTALHLWSGLAGLLAALTGFGVSAAHTVTTRLARRLLRAR